MRDATFFGLMFAAMISVFVLCDIEQSKVEDACTAKGGVLMQTSSGDDLCVKKDAIVK